MRRFYVGFFAVIILAAVAFSGVVIPQLSEESEARHFSRNFVTFCYTPRFHPENSRTIRVHKFLATFLIRFNLGYLGECAADLCSNGIIDPDEQCEPPGDPCDSDGDGLLDDICDAQCQCPLPPASCGNATLDPDEECDDGNSNNGDGCRTNCTEEICGDGIKDPQEECDDGNNADDDGCQGDCTLPNCGDGVIDLLEQCDDAGESPECDDDCSLVMCGDGELNQTAGEECDDGNNNTGDGCRGDCTILGCGDGIEDSEVFVTDGVPSFFIDTYEASRPDADSNLPGVAEHRSCSNPFKQPWVNVTWTDAAAACTAAGKRLCTEEEWELACAGAGAASNTFPYDNVYDALACNGEEYDHDCTPPDADEVLPTGTNYGCPPPVDPACKSTFNAFDMSGNVSEWTATQVGTSVYRVRGGSFNSAESGLTCQFDFVAAAESFSFDNLGFRCCRDP